MLQLIGTGLPVSALIGILAMILALLVGTALGVMAALRQNRWPDYTVMTLAILGICIPSFVTAPLLSLLLGHRSRLAAGGAGTAAPGATWCCRWWCWRCRRSPSSPA